MKENTGSQKDGIPTEVKNADTFSNFVYQVFSNMIGVCIFLTSLSTPPWVFFTTFKLHKWDQIARRTTYMKVVSLNQC